MITFRKTTSYMMPHILMILASKGFRDIEYITPRAFFEQYGFKVSTASSSKISKGRFGYQVKNDFLIEEVQIKEFDGIYLVGGGGSLEYRTNDKARLLVEAFYVAHKPIAAICAAPQNFLHWGLMKGKRVTGHNGDGLFPALAIQFGAIPDVEKTVVYDGGILTANGPEAAEESALEFMKLFRNE
ncbi:MAG TPA: DJ-1/PfpI family protein [Cytophagaceae bacterium]|jgi:putative intracellular protease/amidase|nr:DJ-1/PfpI family protein [Cytophagaceae bacterium]